MNPLASYSPAQNTPPLFSAVITRTLQQRALKPETVSVKDFPSILEGFRSGDPVTLKALYRFVYPKVEQFVLRNSGSQEDAQDLFQETMMHAYGQAIEPGFALSCQLGTYLMAISRNNWMRKLREERPRELQTTGEVEMLLNAEIDTKEDTRELELLMNAKLEELNARDRELLELHLDGASTKAIMQHFGVSSPGYVRKRKCQCKAQLKRLIEKDLNERPNPYAIS